MKTLLKILPMILVVACSPTQTTNEDLAQLHAKRDSLQNVQADIEKQLNNIQADIASIDTSINPNDIKIVKQITMQKNKIVALEKKIKNLENKMTAKDTKKLLPVAIKEMQNEQFDHYIIAYGEVEAKNYAMISPEMGGRIDKIHVKRGQRVSKGQLLVSLNTDAVEMQLKGIETTLEFTTTAFNKQDTLWKQGIGSEIEYLTAKNNKESLEAQKEGLIAQIRMAQIRAPFEGIVDKIFSKEGELAGPTFPVIEFVNLKKLIIKADVSEAYIDKINKGQVVQISFSAMPDLKINTPIVEISNVIASASRTFEIEVQIDNPDEKIIPNMVSTIHINDYSSDQAFVVPSLVIRRDITGDYVYTVHEENGKNVIGKKYIATGLSYDQNTMITDGLIEGDQVVVQGFHLVSAGIPVNVVDDYKN